VISVAEAIPFDSLTESSVHRLYALKGEIVARGVKSVTGIDMPIFPKRRFQHGAVPKDRLHSHLPNEELVYRRRFLSLYA
jgi:asparagine synthase (glutamine-hydrolysing)